MIGMVYWKNPVANPGGSLGLDEPLTPLITVSKRRQRRNGNKNKI